MHGHGWLDGFAALYETLAFDCVSFSQAAGASPAFLSIKHRQGFHDYHQFFCLLK